MTGITTFTTDDWWEQGPRPVSTTTRVTQDNGPSAGHEDGVNEIDAPGWLDAPEPDQKPRIPVIGLTPPEGDVDTEAKLRRVLTHRCRRTLIRYPGAAVGLMAVGMLLRLAVAIVA